MPPSTTTLYRQVAAEGATYIGLLTVVLDSIAEDLRVAGTAASHNDIAGRCTASNHAFLLLGHLESWATEMEELSLRDSLLTFYAYVRSSLTRLQIETSETPFRDLAMYVTQLRCTWQQKEMEMRQSSSISRTDSSSTKPPEMHATRSPTTWSA